MYYHHVGVEYIVAFIGIESSMATHNAKDYRSKVHLYADDTLLFFESISVQAIEAALSQDLDHVVGWLIQNYLMFKSLE